MLPPPVAGPTHKDPARAITGHSPTSSSRPSESPGEKGNDLLQRSTSGTAESLPRNVENLTTPRRSQPADSTLRWRPTNQAAPVYTRRKSTTWTIRDSARPTHARTEMESLRLIHDTKQGAVRPVEETVLEEAGQEIEATIVDPLPNTRSRKASHYMGLFKENAEQQDEKRARAKSKESKKGAKSPDLMQPNLHGQFVPLKDTLATLSGEASDTASKQGSKKIDTVSSAGTDKPESALSSTLHVAPAELIRTHVARSKGQESIEWRGGEKSHGAVPLRLLEEIRSHCFVQPARDDELEEFASESPPSESSLPDIDGKSLPRGASASTQDLSPTEGNDDDEDEFESDKERISAATYFPHHALTPSSGLSEQDKATQESNRSTDRLEFPRRPIEALVDSSSVPLSGGILPPISTQSLSTAEHGIERSHPSSDQDDGFRSSGSPAELFSDTDYETWDETNRSEWGGDESGVTDPRDATPTANFSANKYVHVHAQRGPRGAVELKPYKHQVGGHTKVFSFSKQAICKQLNNRENVFYEVIERYHPELLSFLPKYVFSYFGNCLNAR